MADRNLEGVLVLALDTSTPAVTAAVGYGVAHCLASRTDVANNRHGELLAPLIEQTLADAGVKPADLDVIAVGLGPGPFTGLRVGITTAKAMADALQIPAYGECSLDVIASEVATGEFTYAVVTDARRNQVYWATYSETGARVGGPDIAHPAQLAAQLHGRLSHVVGAGATMYAADFAEFERVDVSYPDAKWLLDVAAKRGVAGTPADVLEPLYLRRPDATPPGRPKQVTPG